MSITNTASQVSYTGNGAQVAFPTTYRFLEQEHLTVEVMPSGGAFATKTLGVDYTVSGEDATDGGTVTFTTAPAASSTVRITRNTPRTQESSLRNNGQSRFSPTVIERALDKLTMIDQEDDRRLDVLEAGATAVTLTASQVTDTFTASEPIENTFPRNVSCSGTPTSVLLARVENLTDPTEILPAEGLLWGSPVAGQFTVRHIEGLTPGMQYRVRYLVLT